MLAAIRRYKWVSAVIVLLGTIAAVAATQVIKPTYRVDTTIVIGDSPDPKGPVRPQVILKEAAWRELLLSFAILDPVARQTGMYLTPRNEADSLLFRGFQPTSDLKAGNYILKVDPATRRYDLAVVRERAEATVETGTLGDSIGRTVGFAWAPDAAAFSAAPGEVKFEVRTPREAANDLRNRLTVNLPPESRFIKVSLTGKRSQALAVEMNSILREFISEAASLKRRNLTDERIALQEQYEHAEATLRQVEGELERLKMRNSNEMIENVVMLPTGGMMTTNPAYADFMTQRIRAESSAARSRGCADAARRRGRHADHAGSGVEHSWRGRSVAQPQGSARGPDEESDRASPAEGSVYRSAPARRREASRHRPDGDANDSRHHAAIVRSAAAQGNGARAPDRRRRT